MYGYLYGAFWSFLSSGSTPVVGQSRITEDSQNRITEDNNQRITE